MQRMRSGFGIAFAAIAALSCFGGAANADPNCHLTRVTSIPMTVDPSGVASIPLAIGHLPLRVGVDTSAGVSALDGDVVDTLGLRTSHVSQSAFLTRRRAPFTRALSSPNFTMTDVYVVAPNVQLGSVMPPEMGFFVAPRHWFSKPLSGFIGTDLLRKFDVEFDFAGGSLNLFLPDHCPGQVVYWTHDPAARLPFDTNHNHQIVIPVELDGKHMQAVIDTGQQLNSASFEKLAGDFGFDEKNPALTATTAPDGKGSFYEYPFKTLSLEGITIQNPKIVLVPTLLHRLSNGPDELLLGTDTLKQLHLFVAYSESAIYITSSAAR